jgi:hypothetical protein
VDLLGSALLPADGAIKQMGKRRWAGQKQVKLVCAEVIAD